MAVYTHVSAEALGEFLQRYDAGELVSAKGIAEGVENSNYLVDTTKDRFILTLYEKRVAADDLPFFMALLDHLAAKGLPVPPAIKDRQGVEIQELCGRPACLIKFLPGVSLTNPTAAQAFAAASELGRMHQALVGFLAGRPNPLGFQSWRSLLERCGAGLDEIAPSLRSELSHALDEVERHWPAASMSVIHADLFPDNVLMRGDHVTGLIDFYFACSDHPLYDLAIMHSAWAFSADSQKFDPMIGRALLDGYFSVRTHYQAIDRQDLSVLAKGACIRFALTRAWDWLNTPADALVTRKDPLAYLRRLRVYREHGAKLFA
jgi:homoserine kinase type II